MKLLFLGDVVGRSGRDAVLSAIPIYRERLSLDFVAVNGENAAGGFGITAEICKSFFDAGVDVITGGNHIWDQQDIVPYLDSQPRLLRPVNHVLGTPGVGHAVYLAANGKKVMVINAMGQVFMSPIDNPFIAVDQALKSVRLGSNVDAILLDFHAEATSEKMAMGHFLDGRVSLVVGSHQQIPTADAQILKGGTAYQTDAGMCGDYDSVIGMKKEVPMGRFLGRVARERMSPSMGEATVCGVLLQTDDATGLATSILPLRQGGRLSPCWPD